MRLRVCSVAASGLIAALGPLAVAQSAPQPADPVEHTYVIHNFHTESGVTLPEVKILYGTYGHLNADGGNAVLLPSHYMANLHGYAWLIRSEKSDKAGEVRALDSGKQFLIATELCGNGRSSSPSNTAEPFHGPRFPVMTIRDNVEAVHQLLTAELGIKHLQAVIGFSMGAQQAFQWAVSYPDFMDRVVATSGTAKTYGHGIVRLESEIAALTADDAFQGGDYKKEPEKGIQAFSLVWTGWLYSQEWWRRELWRSDSPAGTTFQQVLDDYRKKLHTRRRCQRPDLANADMGEQRRRSHPCLSWRCREGPRLHQGASALYAIGDGPVLSADRCPV